MDFEAKIFIMGVPINNERKSLCLYRQFAVSFNEKSYERHIQYGQACLPVVADTLMRIFCFRGPSSGMELG